MLQLKLIEYVSIESSKIITLLEDATFFESEQHSPTQNLTIDFSRDVKVMYKEVKNKQKQYAKHEIEIFSTMLSRLA